MAAGIAGAVAPRVGGIGTGGAGLGDFSVTDATTMGMSQADANTIANGGFVETLIGG